jgi:hypothetical protein
MLRWRVAPAGIVLSLLLQWAFPPSWLSGFKKEQPAADCHRGCCLLRRRNNWLAESQGCSRIPSARALLL